MTDCIIETVSAALATALEDVTVANGYSITLGVQRLRLVDFLDASPTHGTAVLALESVEVDEPAVGPYPITTAKLNYKLTIKIYAADESTAVESLALNAWADVVKCLGLTDNLSNAVYDLDGGLPEINSESGTTGTGTQLIMSITASCRWKRIDPFTAI
jgi:hypothetical protein